MSTSASKSDADYSTGVPGTHSAESTLAARLEALLFVAPGPVTVAQLAAALDLKPRIVEQELKLMAESNSQRGIRLQWGKHGIQWITAPELSEDVERFLELESTSSLTSASLEVLAIIAYQEPVTRPHIDAIRGVNSESSLRTLLRHGMIEEIGRSEGPGRPILYATTADFLTHFGLSSVNELPPIPTDPGEEGSLDTQASEVEGED
ncbi:MAG TPA: SMC-Scp complex subunit ScpB [Anaerolineae bacterium]|nr:SMC-Scp complex subunit ScpB [Anaerolineae bacterium]